MKFEEARAELTEIAGSKYRTLEFELMEYSDGETHIACRVYVDTYGWKCGATWRIVLDAMKTAMLPEVERPIEVEEIPEVEDTPCCP